VPLSREQRDVARVVLAAARGHMALAGGAALVEHGLTDRTTKHLDVFGPLDAERFAEDRAAVMAALEVAGHRVEDVGPASPAFARLLVGRPAGEVVMVELGTDYQAYPFVSTELGPALSVPELGANKILAAYGRSNPRDLDDIARLAPRLGLQSMLESADAKSPTPLDRRVLADTILSSGVREDDSTYPDPERAPAVQAYFREVSARLRDGDVLDVTSPYDPKAAAASKTAGLRIGQAAPVPHGTCGHWMSRALRRCTEPRGHGGQHR
jgi:hypothetical protein